MPGQPRRPRAKRAATGGTAACRPPEYPATAGTRPLSIDLTAPVPPVTPAPIGPGTTTNPQGHTITADSRSLFLDGVPWVPVCGEFHYSRYPRAEWRDALLKMKAGGLDTVSTYVFWIHHEEQRGQFDWSGDRSLRDFLRLVQQVGLKAIVRLGPWCHGEVRNGGFPDWVRAQVEYGSTDPAFRTLMDPWFAEIARQMQGLLWKDGGPVIAVQLDNENNDPPYLLMLKKVARELGVDVPFYTMTGWNQVAIPQEGLLPLFGAYAAGFWEGSSAASCRKSFLFSHVRDDGDLGAQLQNLRPTRNQHLESFPFACAEIGPGMLSSYHVRLKINPDDSSAMALVKLGSGNNMPGYYMYHGGTNPEGQLTTLHEYKPNAMPVKDYDMQTALGAAGQVRKQFHWLRQQHLFLHDFGPALARMPAFFPGRRPQDLQDTATLRWNVRADGRGHGFLFFNNRQPVLPLPDKKDVQFELQTGAGPLLLPRTPITIPAGAFGIWPIGLDCDGVRLEYATVQPLCRVADGDDRVAYFFTAIEGVRPELALQGQDPQVVTPGTGPAWTTQNPKGKTVLFVVLTPEQGRDFYRPSFAGRERAILAQAVVLVDGASLRLRGDAPAPFEVAIFPPLPAVHASGTKVHGVQDGLFSRCTLPGVALQPVHVSVTSAKPAGPQATSLQGNEEATWDDAAVYQLGVPDSAAGRHLVLDVHYIGDVARLYIGDKLFLDNFYNGDPMSIALWRIPRADWPKLRLKVLPYSEALAKPLCRLPDAVLQEVARAKAQGTVDRITVTVTELFESQITPA